MTKDSKYMELVKKALPLTVNDRDEIAYELQENFLTWLSIYCPKTDSEIRAASFPRSDRRIHWMNSVFRAKKIQMTEKFIKKVKKAFSKILESNNETFYDFTLYKHTANRFNFFCFTDSKERTLGATGERS